MYQSKEDVRLRVFRLSNGGEIEDLNRLLEDPGMNVLRLELLNREESSWRFFIGRRSTEMSAVVLFERVAHKPAAKKRSPRSASKAASSAPAARGAGARKKARSAPATRAKKAEPRSAGRKKG